MTKKDIEHQDIFGRKIQVGTAVATSRRNSLVICTVSSMSKKMIRVKQVGKKSSWRVDNGFLVYPSDAIVLEGPEVTLYVLKALAP